MVDVDAAFSSCRKLGPIDVVRTPAVLPDLSCMR
jgi:hypothetical protein